MEIDNRVITVLLASGHTIICHFTIVATWHCNRTERRATSSLTANWSRLTVVSYASSSVKEQLQLGRLSRHEAGQILKTNLQSGQPRL